MTELKVGNATLRMVQGDITAGAVDAIVNAASSSLLGGGAECATLEQPGAAS